MKKSEAKKRYAEKLFLKYFLELLVEAFFVGLFFWVYPKFLATGHDLFKHYDIINFDYNLRLWGDNNPPIAIAGLSFISRIFTFEIFLRCWFRYYYAKNYGFKLKRALLITFTTHTIIFYIFFVLIDGTIFRIEQIAILTLSTLPPSVMSALMAIVVMKYVFCNTFDSLIQNKETARR